MNSFSGKMPWQHKIKYFLIVCKGMAVFGKGFFWFSLGVFLIGAIYCIHFEYQANQINMMQMKLDNIQTRNEALGFDARHLEVLQALNNLKKSRHE